MEYGIDRWSSFGLQEKCIRSSLSGSMDIDTLENGQCAFHPLLEGPGVVREGVRNCEKCEAIDVGQRKKADSR